MLVYFLICLAISLAGIAGLQFFYIAYLDRMGKYQKNYVRLLEKHCKYLNDCLKKADAKIIEQKVDQINEAWGGLKEADSEIIEQKTFIDSTYEKLDKDEEVWADVIEDR